MFYVSPDGLPGGEPHSELHHVLFCGPIYIYIYIDIDMTLLIVSDIHCTLYIAHYMICIVHCTLHDMHYPLYMFIWPCDGVWP